MLVAGGLAAPVVLLLGTISLNWEVRVAAARSLLSETPYSQLASRGEHQGRPGEAGRDRMDPLGPDRPRGKDSSPVPRETRRGSGRARTSAASQATERGDRFLTFTARIDSVKKPMEYRAAAGSLESPIYRIDVRYSAGSAQGG